MGEIWVKGLISVLAILVILWESRTATLPSSRLSKLCLLLIASVSILAYFNFGFFHGSTYAGGWLGFRYRFIHQWEQFHYFLNAKYFKELGYDGLYLASIAAQKQSDPLLASQKYVRDMHSNQVVPVSQLDALTQQVVARFTPERWSSFVRDNHFFITTGGRDYLTMIRTDHGFNGSPTWVFIARFFCRTLGANLDTLFFLGSLDILLLGFMFFAIHSVYGWRVLCWTLILFGLSYPSRYYWNGGAFLRLDWLVASVLGVCMLKKKNYFWAGLLFGYAVMSRLFPVFFLIGPCILFFKDVVQHRPTIWFVRLCTGLSMSIALGFALGSFTGRGMNVWNEYAADIQKHRHTWLTNNVGLENILIYDSHTYNRDLVNWRLPDPWQSWQTYMNEIQEEQHIPILVVTAIFLVFVARVSWQATIDESVVINVAAIFALSLLTCYYWVMLILVGLKRGSFGTILVLFLNAVLLGVHIFYDPVFEIIYGCMSWGLVAFFVLWMGYDLLVRTKQVFAMAQARE